MMTRQEELKAKLAKLTPAERAQMAKLATPRIVEPYTRHIPHPTQQVFLGLQCQEALFGGAAGGGKSDALLMAALQYVDVPGYAALLLRRTYADLVLPNAIMDRAMQWLSGTPAKKHDGGKLWTFPSGAKLQFGYLQQDSDKYRYQGIEVQYVGFDELTQWKEEETYNYLFSRIRRPSVACLTCRTALARIRDPKGKTAFVHTEDGAEARCPSTFPDPKVLAQYRPSKGGVSIFDVPLRMRAATNPGGRGAHWVKDRFINPKTKRKGTIFIPSRLSDNPSLDQKSYKEQLEFLSIVDRERLLNGDWDITEGGDMFERGDFVSVDSPAPDKAKRVRFWDMAASENMGDYTVGILGAMWEDKFYIEHMVRAQRRPHEVEKLVYSTAHMDGLNVHIRMEQEGGSSGKAIVDSFKRHVLPGFNFDGIKSTGSKSARASALATYGKKDKLVLMIRDQWNRPFLDEVEAFPNGAHDDIVDACAGAFNYLSFGRKRARLLA